MSSKAREIRSLPAANARLATFGRVAMTFSAVIGQGSPCYLAICCEPGMGGREMASLLLADVAQRDFATISRSLTAMGATEIVRLISRLGRESIKPDVSTLLLLDDVPPLDEGEVARVVRAIRKIERPGVSVLVTLAPEARQLIEALPEFKVVWGFDLVSEGDAIVSASRRPYELRAVTRGIPSLVESLRDSPYLAGSSDLLPQAYFDALGTLASCAVRRGLSDEEARVRLAMLLLGKGSADELSAVIGRDVTEVLGGLRTEAVIFGITPGLDEFCCLGSDEHVAIAGSLPRLRMECENFPQVALHVVAALIRRGDHARAAVLCKALLSQGYARLVIEGGAEFLDVLETALVRKSLIMSETEPSEWYVSRELLERAVEHVAQREIGPFDAEGISATSAPDEAALLFVDARRALRGLPSLAVGSRAPEGTLARRLRTHRDACDLMVSGRMGDALRLLLASPVEEGESVSRALLVLDREAARLLTGDAGERDRERVDAALARLGDARVAGLSSYSGMVTVMRATMSMDPSADAGAEALASRAERCGDALAQVVALVAGCVCDLRGGSFARASVRASLARGVSERRDMGYLARVSELLDEVSRFMAGERVDATAPAGPDDDLGVVAGFVTEVMVLEEEPLSFGGEASPRVPRDALWLLRLLLRGMGELSALLRDRMPQPWRRALSSMADGAGRCGDVPEGAGAPHGEKDGWSSPVGRSAPVEVTLLGGFEMRVRGVRVSDWKLERRSAKAVLEYLLLRRGGSAKRYQIVEQVWPESDYTTGFNRAYQATSALRAAIAEIDPGLDPFVTSRSSQEISLDTGLISCDVEPFRVLAREASDAADPARALAAARRVEKLYAGDLYLPSADGTGLIASIREDLRELYSDAMAAGGDAALRLGQDRTAARLASNALSANDLREDAMVTLVRALRGCGRTVEAERRFRHFSNRLRRAGGGAPSARLLDALGGSHAPA